MMNRKMACVVTIGLIVAVMTSYAADSKEETAALSAAEEWLASVDNGNYAESWASAAELFKKAVQRQQWEQMMKSGRQPLGKLISRKVIAKDFKSSMPSVPDGQYIVIQFAASFEHKNKAVETVTPMLGRDGRWRVSGYYIK